MPSWARIEGDDLSATDFNARKCPFDPVDGCVDIGIGGGIDGAVGVVDDVVEVLLPPQLANDTSRRTSTNGWDNLPGVRTPLFGLTAEEFMATSLARSSTGKWALES